MANILDLSGGATKFIALVSSARALFFSGYSPTHICGTSSGSIAMVPVALGLWETMHAMGTNLKIEDFMDDPPLRDGAVRWGKVLHALLAGKNHIGSQDVSTLLSKAVTPEMFERYRKGDYARCYAVCYSVSDSRTVFYDVKSMDYEGYLRSVEASCAIPLLTEGVGVGGKRMYDGGVVDHIGGAKFMEYLNAEGVATKGYVAVFSRPREGRYLPEGWDRNLASVAKALLSRRDYEKSQSDADMARYYCLWKGIDFLDIYSPRVLESLYDTDNGRLEELSKQSYISALKQIEGSWLTRL